MEAIDSSESHAFYYVLDRVTGKFISGQAFARQMGAKGLDSEGHPVVILGTDPSPEGVLRSALIHLALLIGPRPLLIPRQICSL